MTRPTSTRCAALLAGIALLAAACGGGRAAAPPATAAPGAASAASTGGGGPAASPTAEPVASTAALPDSALPRVRFLPLGGAAVATLAIEVPPETEYGVGLSGRTSLVERGMLFYFPAVVDVPFWMQGTHIDLDIAFVDRGLKVVTVTTMKADTQDYHRSAAPFLAAIEAPAGWYTAHGVRAGATVAFDFDLKAVTGR